MLVFCFGCVRVCILIRAVSFVGFEMKEKKWEDFLLEFRD